MLFDLCAGFLEDGILARIGRSVGTSEGFCQVKRPDRDIICFWGIALIIRDLSNRLVCRRISIQGRKNFTPCRVFLTSLESFIRQGWGKGSGKCFGKGKHRIIPASGTEYSKYIGPGLLVTVGFIDPGNWASNVVAGADFGYTLLWMVTLSTFMLILLQHNVAHLGIVTGLCLSEACVRYLHPWRGRALIVSAVLASVSTALAELLGGGIGLMLFPGFHYRCVLLVWLSFCGCC